MPLWVVLVPLDKFHQRLHLCLKSVGENAGLFHNSERRMSGIEVGNLLVKVLEVSIVVLDHLSNLFQLGANQIKLLVCTSLSF